MKLKVEDKIFVIEFTIQEQENGMLFLRYFLKPELKNFLESSGKTPHSKKRIYFTKDDICFTKR